MDQSVDDIDLLCSRAGAGSPGSLLHCPPNRFAFNRHSAPQLASVRRQTLASTTTNCDNFQPLENSF